MGNAPVQKPSLWRSLLAGALTGFGVGMSGAEPEQIAPLTLGAMENQEQARLRQAQFASQERRAQTREQREAESFALQKQQAELSIEEMKNRIKMLPDDNERRAQENALLQIQVETAKRQLSLLPADKQEALREKSRETAREFIGKGLWFVEPEPQDAVDFQATEAFRIRVMQKDIQEDGKLDFRYVTLPSPYKADSFVVFRLEPDKKLTEPSTVTIGKKSFTFPIGTPVDVYAKAKLEALFKEFEVESEAQTAIKVAQIRQQKAELEKPLSMKEALAQARQEIAPMVEADAYLPTSRRQYPDQGAVTKAVNKRAQELLDLDSQLRRSGISETRNIVSALSALKEQRRRGGSDAQLKQLIATAAAQGQLAAAEIVELYNQLGLVPSAPANAQPQAGPQKQASAGELLPHAVE